MSKTVIITDTHVGAPNATHTAYSLAMAIKTYMDDGYKVVLLGDNIDMANCKKSEVDDCFKLVKYYVDFSINNKDFVYLTGNHERYTTEPEQYIDGHRLFRHGDLLDNPERWAKYREKPHGAGWLKRNIWVRLIILYEKFFDREPSDRLIANARKCIERLNAQGENITEIHVGHFHYSASVDLGNGLTLYVYDQGEWVLSE